MSEQPVHVKMLIGGGRRNNVTTTKQPFAEEVLFMAASEASAKGTLLSVPADASASD